MKDPTTLEDDNMMPSINTIEFTEENPLSTLADVQITDQLQKNVLF